MKKQVKLSEIMALPIKLSKVIQEKQFNATETLKQVNAEGLLDEYKGPFTSDVKASCIFNDTITTNCFYEQKQPDGTYLITYVSKYFEEYKLSLYVRVLTSGLKRTLKYHQFKDGSKLKISGDLDMYIADHMFFDKDGDGYPDKLATIGVAITIIDLL